MPQYLVKLPAEAQGASQTNNRDAMLVTAESEAEARAAAKAAPSAGPNRDKWDSADVTELSEGAAEDYALRVRIFFDDADEEYTDFLAPAGEASFNDLAVAMRDLLLADDRIGAGNASVAAGPPVVLTIAAGASIGDRPIVAELLLEGNAVEDYAVVSAEGAAASARTITFPDPTAVDLVAIHAELTDEKF